MAKHHKGGRSKETGWLQTLLNIGPKDQTLQEGRLVDDGLVAETQARKSFQRWFSTYHKNDGAHEEIVRMRRLERLG